MFLTYCVLFTTVLSTGEHTSKYERLFQVEQIHAAIFVGRAKEKLIASSVNQCYINVACYIKPADMYLQSA